MKHFALIALLCLTALGTSSEQHATASATAPESHQPGRYQIFFSPHARADVYLLDTETGKIWRPMTINNAKDTNLASAPEIWLYQDRIDTEQGFDTWQQRHVPTDAPTNP